MKPRLFCLIVLVAAALGRPGPAGAQQEKGQLCPVMLGHEVSKKFYVDYAGRRVYLCCRSCMKAFQKHPERYSKNLA